MKYLLDTHTLLWFLEGDTSLSQIAIELIENEEHIKYISIASIWEISIKHSLGKLLLTKELRELFAELLLTEIQVLPISFNHILRLNSLDFHHRDPFDRLIIAQGQEEGLTIITKDAIFSEYEVGIIW
ncbi:type II toxin-antitoxin system VapC family toxin [Telluribacter humicola]|uniref:type II toxin-antitoxin system VapC family toxin n=1 Tax=Telluribacter humicola TaxID=1720261 RepID=UPI001A9583FF|nr:type II toxin-antitoxin system VapC family toxin [Telluribacter humicola]